MPIFSFGLMVKDTFLSTRGRFSRYRISAFSKTTSPSCGQSRGGVLFLIRAGASNERVFKRKTKSSVSSKQSTKEENYQMKLSAALCRLSPYQFKAVKMNKVTGYQPSDSETISQILHQRQTTRNLITCS